MLLSKHVNRIIMSPKSTNLFTLKGRFNNIYDTVVYNEESHITHILASLSNVFNNIFSSMDKYRVSLEIY